MMTFRVSHFENKRNFFAAFNGGKLYVTDDEYIIKWLFVKIRFPRDKTQIVFYSDFFFGNVIISRAERGNGKYNSHPMLQKNSLNM